MLDSNTRSVSSDEFRAACGLFPTGVTVVTRRLADGRPYGMTVSSFTSVSLEPPLILVCIDRAARFLQDIASGLSFGINVLNESQQELSALFSNRSEENRFSFGGWEFGWNNVPVISESLAVFFCALEKYVEAGDHLVLIGYVREILRQEGRPLVWCDRAYHCLPVRRVPG